MKSIAAKMNAALKQIDAVTKEGRNQAQGYNYVKAADVANEVRKALAAVGIAFNYNIADYERWSQERFDRDGKQVSPMNWCSMKVEGSFIDTESGESLTSTGLGWGSDVGDKAPYKAMTGALKYILRMTFLIPDESDPENDEAEQKVQQTVAAQKKAPAESPELEWSFNDKTGVLICRVIDARSGESKTKDKRPFYSVKINGKVGDKDMIFCWHQSMFPHLAKSKGHICKFIVSVDGKGFWSLDEVMEINGEKIEKADESETQARLLASTMDITEEQLQATLTKWCDGSWKIALDYLRKEKDRRNAEPAAQANPFDAN